MENFLPKVRMQQKTNAKIYTFLPLQSRAEAGIKANQKNWQKNLAKSKIYEEFNHFEGGRALLVTPLPLPLLTMENRYKFDFLPCRDKLLLGDEQILQYLSVLCILINEMQSP
jgi:hypothetical protein